ncbi:MAG: hypothetical protein AB3K77_03855 [Methanosarcinaceae archaeon]
MTPETGKNLGEKKEEKPEQLEYRIPPFISRALARLFPDHCFKEIYDGKNPYLKRSLHLKKQSMLEKPSE